MTNSTYSLKEQMKCYKVDYNLFKKTECSGRESDEFLNTINSGEALPNDILCIEIEKKYFYRLEQSDLTKEEEQEYLIFQQLSLLNTIKNYLRFIIILAAIGIFSGIILVLIYL